MTAPEIDAINSLPGKFEDSKTTHQSVIAHSVDRLQVTLKPWPFIFWQTAVMNWPWGRSNLLVTIISLEYY